MANDLLQFDCLSIEDVYINGGLIAGFLSLLIEKEVKQPVSYYLLNLQPLH